MTTQFVPRASLKTVWPLACCQGQKETLDSQRPATAFPHTLHSRDKSRVYLRQRLRSGECEDSAGSGGVEQAGVSPNDAQDRGYAADLECHLVGDHAATVGIGDDGPQHVATPLKYSNCLTRCLFSPSGEHFGGSEAASCHDKACLGANQDDGCFDQVVRRCKKCMHPNESAAWPQPVLGFRCGWTPVAPLNTLLALLAGGA